MENRQTNDRQLTNNKHTTGIQLTDNIQITERKQTNNRHTAGIQFTDNRQTITIQHTNNKQPNLNLKTQIILTKG